MKVRPATTKDTGQMADILNAIIEVGGSTALESFVDGRGIGNWMARSPGRTTWLVAEDATQLLGFQWTEPNPALPENATDIATFARIGMAGKGIGTALFEATKERCRTLEYTWIKASIRSDNTSGLSYYSKMGFVDWKSDPTVALSDGTVTGKTYKRYDL